MYGCTCCMCVYGWHDHCRFRGGCKCKEVIAFDHRRRGRRAELPGAASSPRVIAMTDLNVLVIVGIRVGSVDAALAQLAAQSPSDGITVRVFESLGDLPSYSETLERHRTPEAVVALRAAATRADAVLIVTSYHGRVPAMVPNAIDWLTRRWNHAALHDKPLAIIAPAPGCYSGVWSHHHTEDAHHTTGPRLTEPITVATLREAVRRLAGEVNAGSDVGFAIL